MHRRNPGAELREQVAVSLYVFDVLEIDGRSLLWDTYNARREVLVELGLDVLGHAPASGDMYAEGRQQLDVLIGQLAGASAKRATLLTAAALLCAWETKADTHTWRQRSEQTQRYLGQMQT